MTGLRDNLGRAGRLLLHSKLYWGLLVVLIAGVLISPGDGAGGSVFLSAGNLSDVLRQVSITGVVAVGMTLVILTGGIDLSVGSVMALGATLAAMLLTLRGWNGGAVLATPLASIAWGGVAFLALAALSRPVGRRGLRLAICLGGAAALAGGVFAWLSSQLPSGMGTSGVLVACLGVGLAIGGLSGLIVARGGLQPFIATLAMMVAVLGVARLTAGPDQSVYPIYSGANAPRSIELLRLSAFGVPVPGLVFVAVAAAGALLLARLRVGREIYAIGGNERAARLAGVNVVRTKVLVYALSGMLAALAGVLYAAQYRQGKPDAGAGLELDAIAAVVIGGASLSGGRGTVRGTVIGVLIFGFLTNIFQLANIDSNTQLVLKGAIILAAVWLQQGSGPGLAKLRSAFR